MRNQILCAVLTSIAIALTGCSSIHTTHVKRNEDRCGWDTKHLHGIPITLEVPHEYQIQIVERQYVSTSEKGLVVVKTADGKPATTTYVKVEVTTTKEVFTVDFIKPGAGTLQTKADLDPANQYFTKIDNVIEDTTIEAIKNALVTVTGALPTAPKGKSTGLMPIGAKAAVTPFDKIIAVGVVSVNDPNAKEKIHDFLCRHLNGCSNPVCPVTIEPKATRTTPSFPSAMPVGTPKVSGASLKLLQAGGYVTGNDAGPKVTPIAPNLLK